MSRETDIILAARRRKGFSQQHTAELIGINLKQYQRLEYGEHNIGNSPMRIGLALCAVLDINPMTLVFNKPTRK